MLPTFLDPHLLEEALTHRSVIHESRGKVSNERLEFLGDAVLELATTLFLYKKLPEAPEGSLTSFRSSLVKRHTLAQVATSLGLGDRLAMSKGEENMGGRKNPALLENAFEAVIGALYQDQGFEACYAFLEIHLFVQFDAIVAGNLHRDYKSTLQEHIQSLGSPTPTYKTLSASGPDHQKHFEVAVLVNDEIIGTGAGKSKQEASQSAAHAALEKLNLT